MYFSVYAKNFVLKTALIKMLVSLYFISWLVPDEGFRLLKVKKYPQVTIDFSRNFIDYWNV